MHSDIMEKKEKSPLLWHQARNVVEDGAGEQRFEGKVSLVP